VLISRDQSQLARIFNQLLFFEIFLILTFIFLEMKGKRGRDHLEISSGRSGSVPVEEETLFSAVLSGKFPMSTLAGGWIERYQENG